MTDKKTRRTGTDKVYYKKKYKKLTGNYFCANNAVDFDG